MAKLDNLFVNGKGNDRMYPGHLFGYELKYFKWDDLLANSYKWDFECLGNQLPKACSDMIPRKIRMSGMEMLSSLEALAAKSKSGFGDKTGPDKDLFQLGRRKVHTFSL
jgi:hypothetical protein